MFDARQGSPYAYRRFLAGPDGSRLGHVMGRARVGDLAKVTASAAQREPSDAIDATDAIAAIDAIDAIDVTTIVLPRPSGNDAFGRVVVVAEGVLVATSVEQS